MRPGFHAPPSTRQGQVDRGGLWSLGRDPRFSAAGHRLRPPGVSGRDLRGRGTVGRGGAGPAAPRGRLRWGPSGIPVAFGVVGAALSFVRCPLDTEMHLRAFAPSAPTLLSSSLFLRSLFPEGPGAPS